jgi:hypothetical protein
LVVTIPIIVCIAVRSHACQDHLAGNPRAVGVAVSVPGAEHALVNLAVTVIVSVIANFLGRIQIDLAQVFAAITGLTVEVVKSWKTTIEFTLSNNASTDATAEGALPAAKSTI